MYKMFKYYYYKKPILTPTNYQMMYISGMLH